MAARISALASLHGSTPFPPHVTLLGDIRRDETDVLAAATRFARATSPVPVRLVAAAVRDEYFRRLVLEAEPTHELKQARAQAASALVVPASGFEPHLSLLYGRAVIRPEDAGLELPLLFTCRELAIWKTEGPVTEWRPLGRMPLGSSEIA